MALSPERVDSQFRSSTELSNTLDDLPANDFTNDVLAVSSDIYDFACAKFAHLFKDAESSINQHLESCGHNSSLFKSFFDSLWHLMEDHLLNALDKAEILFIKSMCTASPTTSSLVSSKCAEVDQEIAHELSCIASLIEERRNLLQEQISRSVGALQLPESLNVKVPEVEDSQLVDLEDNSLLNDAQHMINNLNSFLESSPLERHYEHPSLQIISKLGVTDDVLKGMIGE
ncbi:hypothetical protein P9112_001944 [Eukaryota sp. TZLM1-RC]